MVSSKDLKFRFSDRNSNFGCQAAFPTQKYSCTTGLSYYRQRQARYCHFMDETRVTAVHSPRVPSHHAHGYEITTSDRAAHDNVRVGSQRDTGNWIRCLSFIDTLPAYLGSCRISCNHHLYWQPLSLIVSFTSNANSRP